MQWHLLRNELKAMLQFHKSVLLLIIKALLGAFRYGLWLLPWIFLAVFLWRPAFEGWKLFTQDTPGSGSIRSIPVYASSYGGASVPGKSLGWETVQNKVDSGMRAVERLSKQIRKK